MRLLLILILIYSGRLEAQSKIYNINFLSWKGNLIKLADYSGKKILIASVSPVNLQNGQLSYLDSLQMANPSIIVIAVPANDFGGNNNQQVLDAMQQNQNLRLIVSALDLVKKSNGNNQQKLLKWLTNASENSHFDREVLTDNQLYLVSESGYLYAVLESGVPASVLNQLLKQADVKQ